MINALTPVHQATNGWDVLMAIAPLVFLGFVCWLIFRD
jgi:hypothetical protein